MSRKNGLYVLADLLDSISGAEDEVDALLDAYNEDRITLDRLLDELRALVTCGSRYNPCSP
jgi:hypothetical protein